MTCGKALGGAMGYRKTCGGLWMGEIAQCSKCRRKELELENIRLQNKLIKLQIRKERETIWTKQK